MANDLELIERQLEPMTPIFAQALAGSNLAPEKLVRTVLISLERTPTLLGCTRPSIMQCAMTAAVLGLEADGALGQFYMVPFGGKAQSIIGYRGWATLAGRSGFTTNGAVVREGDQFEFELGSEGFVRHRPQLGGGRGRRIIGSWATATKPGHSPIVQVLDIDELMFVKGRSPGARKSDSPWNDAEIGFAAMCEKTAKRRLARSLPINLYVAAAMMDEIHEEAGKHTYLDRDKGLVIDGEAQPIGGDKPQPELSSLNRPAFILHARGREVPFDTIERWRSSMIEAINAIGHGNVNAFRELNQPTMDEYRGRHRDHVEAVEAAFVIKMQRSPSGGGERPPDVVAGSGDAQGAANIPERAEVVDPSPKPPPETRGAGSDSETDARQTDPANGQNAVDAAVAGGSPAPKSRDPWFDNADLSIKPPQRGNRPDWPAWSTLFFQKTAIASDGTDLAMLIGSNETNITAFKAALGPMEAQHFDAAIARLYEKLP